MKILPFQFEHRAQFEQNQVSNDEFSLLKGTEMEFNFQFFWLFHFYMLYFLPIVFPDISLTGECSAQCHNGNATATLSRFEKFCTVWLWGNMRTEQMREKIVITFLFFNFPAFSQYIFHYIVL